MLVSDVLVTDYSSAIYEFSLRHVVEPDNPLEMFPIEYDNV